jgi:zinc finger FYVE domain-containing protein 26
LVPQLQKALRKNDPQLKSANNYLLALCKYLNENEAYSVLLEFQLFMRDFVRAGLTCIKLFHSASDLAAKLKYLEESKAHFIEALTELQEMKEGTSSSLASTSSNQVASGMLNQAEISKYLRSVNLQIEVTKFFYAQSRSSNPPLHLSLFAHQTQKSEIAEEILAYYNYELAFRVIQDYRLPMIAIYKAALAKIARKKQSSRVNDLLKQIKGTIEDKEWDDIVLEVIKIFATELGDMKTGESLVGKLILLQSKVLGYAFCRKLKSAYLLAVKSNNLSLVQYVRDEAQRQNATTVLELCQKFLQAHQ